MGGGRRSYTTGRSLSQSKYPIIYLGKEYEIREKKKESKGTGSLMKDFLQPNKRKKKGRIIKCYEEKKKEREVNRLTLGGPRAFLLMGEGSLQGKKGDSGSHFGGRRNSYWERRREKGAFVPKGEEEFPELAQKQFELGAKRGEKTSATASKEGGKIRVPSLSMWKKKEGRGGYPTFAEG